jgi:hypothetical protein
VTHSSRYISFYYRSFIQPNFGTQRSPKTTTVTPRLFFTSDNGPEAIKLTPLELMDPEYIHIQDAGAAVLRAYDDVLMMLEGDCAGDIRLQNGLAAAVAGLSAKDFSDLFEDEKKSYRLRFVHTPIHRQLAPDLIIYIGVPRARQDKLATSGRIQFNEAVQDSEFYPWDDIVWEKRELPPTAWSWVARSLYPQAQFIFVAGVFVTWPVHWSQQSDQSEDSSRKLALSINKLLIQLRVTLYHELAHYLRNLVCLFLLPVDINSL